MRTNSRNLALFWPLLLALFALSVLIAVAAHDPRVLFTSNTAVSAPSTVVAPMEQKLLDQINSAAVSIDLAIYDFNRVSIRDALAAAANRGVAVRVVTDDEALANPGYAPHFAALSGAGITVVDDGRSSIMHNKFFIFDGQMVWSGSTNITDNGFTYNHNNSLVITSTLLAQVYTQEFEEMFVDGRFGTAKTDNTLHSIDAGGIPVDLYFSPSDGALDQLIAAVDTAASNIQFSIFFFTDDKLRDALLARMAQGVTVSGVWDALGASNAYSDDETLCAAGAGIKIETFGGKVHHKFMVIDPDGPNPVLITGSMNWTNSGGSANDENTLIIHDSHLAQAYSDGFQELYDALPPETLCNRGTQTFLPVITSPGTDAPPSDKVRIIQITYNPDGSDAAGEYVLLRNDGTATANMSGWVLYDEANNRYTFPSFSLPPAASVAVWTGSGSNDSANLYWGSGSAIWNNSGDSAVLANGGGQIVDYCSYAGGGISAACE